VTLTPVSPVAFLVRSKGAEAGIRTQPNKDVVSTFSVFVLDFDSEICVRRRRRHDGGQPA
jgi:hypothetical protein